MGWEPKQPQNILQATRQPPAPGPGVPWSISWPGCPWHPQVPQQAGADEICSSTGRSQAAGCEEAPSHHIMAEVMAGEETLAKAQSREEKGDPGCGAGATAAVPVPKGWAEIGWHLITAGLKSVFSSQEPKPLAAARERGSQHPLDQREGARAPQHSRGAWGQGVGPCLHPSPAHWAHEPFRSNPGILHVLEQTPCKGKRWSSPSPAQPPHTTQSLTPAARARPHAAWRSPAGLCVGHG